MKNRKSPLIATCLLVVVAALIWMAVGNKPEPATRLPDGTIVKLARVSFTTNLNHVQMVGSEWAMALRPLMPSRLEKLFIKPQGGIGLGSSTEPKLLILFEYKETSGTPELLSLLRVRDEEGNSFDGDVQLGGSTGAFGGVSLSALSTVPRRTRKLFLEPLFNLPNGEWAHLGPFEVSNPWYGRYPQWTPEPVPQSRTNAGLILTLDEFSSGEPASAWPQHRATVSADVPRSTRLKFSFRENGIPATGYRLHSVAISDATGNQIGDNLHNLSQRNHPWTTNGSVELPGSLWPGEDAWKIEVKALLTADFTPDELWEVPTIFLVDQETYLNLTNRFKSDEVSVRLIDVSDRNVNLPEPVAIVLWLYPHSDEHFIVGIMFEEAMGDHRPVVVQATDQNNRPIQLMDHVATDYAHQALLFQKAEGATELHLKLAFPELKTFEFLARPEFVE